MCAIGVCLAVAAWAGPSAIREPVRRGPRACRGHGAPDSVPRRARPCGHRGRRRRDPRSQRLPRAARRSRAFVAVALLLCLCVRSTGRSSTRPRGDSGRCRRTRPGSRCGRARRRRARCSRLLRGGSGCASGRGIAVIGSSRVGVGLAVELRSAEPFGGRLAALEDTDPNLAAAGSTRLAEPLSQRATGRMARRVARGRQDPLVGQGQGTFTRAWTKERRLRGALHRPAAQRRARGLQRARCDRAGAVPSRHRRGRRRCRHGAVTDSGSAAALGALTALLGQAVVDWTWSFPGLLVPVLLVAGARPPGLRGRPPAKLALVVGAVVVFSRRRQPPGAVAGAAVGRCGGRASPWTTRRSRSQRLETARQWNRWNPLALEIRGSVREAQGAFVAARPATTPARRRSCVRRGSITSARRGRRRQPGTSPAPGERASWATPGTPPSTVSTRHL